MSRFALLALPLLLAGCLEQRALVVVPATSEALQDPAGFTLQDGTHVVLSRARLQFADVLFEEPAVAARWALIPSAHAHAGHDHSGAETGELLGTFGVDLLETAELGEVRLLEGTYATARMQWSAESTALTLQGTATRPTQEPMPLSFAIAEDRTVTNMPFEAAVDTANPPTKLRLQVDLAGILGDSDWSTSDADGDGTLTGDDGDLGATVRFGARTSAHYRWALESGGGE